MLTEIVTDIEAALPKGFVLQNFHYNVQKDGKFWMGARAAVPGFDGAEVGVEMEHTAENVAAAGAKIVADLGGAATAKDADLVAMKAKLDAYVAGKK